MIRLSHCFLTFLVFVVFNQLTHGKVCEPHSMRGLACGANETCTSTGVCECKPGFKILNETCQNATEKDAPGALPVTHSTVTDTSSSHVAAGILIPLFLILVVIIGIFLNHKYRLISWVRSKINQRYTSYDEVMIGQDLDDDDPPLR